MTAGWTGESPGSRLSAAVRPILVIDVVRDRRAGQGAVGCHAALPLQRERRRRLDVVRRIDRIRRQWPRQRVRDHAVPSPAGVVDGDAADRRVVASPPLGVIPDVDVERLIRVAGAEEARTGVVAVRVADVGIGLIADAGPQGLARAEAHHRANLEIGRGGRHGDAGRGALQQLPADGVVSLERSLSSKPPRICCRASAHWALTATRRGCWRRRPRNVRRVEPVLATRGRDGLACASGLPGP
jgi:hypothetical protein